jgi:hypothetical protein
MRSPMLSEMRVTQSHQLSSPVSTLPTLDGLGDSQSLPYLMFIQLLNPNLGTRDFLALKLLILG